jgi:uncharacterized membrane protein
MSTDAQSPSEPSRELIEIPPKRLWFGFIGPIIAWLGLGCVDITIIWRACQHQENFGIPSEHPAVSWVLFFIGLAFAAITATAGVISHRDFRRLAHKETMLDSLAVPRGEYMAVIGVILSVTLTAGMVWMSITSLFVDLCWRAR